jgi:excisionase family DNA binding protein
VTARPRPPLGAHVRGFAAWLLVLELERSLPARLDSLVAQGVAPALVGEARACWADLRQASEQWQEWRASGGGNPEIVSAEMPPGLEQDDNISTREAAVMLGVGPRMVRVLLADGRLPGRRVGGRWLVSRKSVMVLREARRVA